MSPCGAKADMRFARRDACLLVNIQDGVVEVISCDRFDQFLRDACFAFSARSSSILQQRQGGSTQPNGAQVAVKSALSAARRPQADPGLGTAHFERVDL